MNSSSGIVPAPAMSPQVQVPNLQTALNPHQHFHTQSGDSLPLLVMKRSASWRYLQRVYQGGTVLYNTAILSETELRKTYGPSDEKIQRRTLQYFLLGTSLATILEIPNAADCLRAMYNLIQEYDALTMSESKAKIMFLRNTGRRVLDGGKSFEETGEYSLLEVRNLPFHLDYIITFTSLCDMIAQTYEKLGSSDQVWSLTNLEMFQKIDTRFKKILTTVSKELETLAREVMVEELNAMDPLGVSSHDDWDI
ncbi:hypothetical protein CPB97_010389 [Podila verticillata]|nr:hypothetical protein CPB97_010389 [Podila verticillata]